MISKQTIEEKWRGRSEAGMQEAKKLPFGKKREDLLREARQLLKIASQINQWLPVPALQRPK